MDWDEEKKSIRREAALWYKPVWRLSLETWAARGGEEGEENGWPGHSQPLDRDPEGVIETSMDILQPLAQPLVQPPHEVDLLC